MMNTENFSALKMYGDWEVLRLDGNHHSFPRLWSAKDRTPG